MPRKHQRQAIVPEPTNNFRHIDRSAVASFGRAARAWQRFWQSTLGLVGLCEVIDHYGPILGDRYAMKRVGFTQSGRCLPKGTVVAFLDFGGQKGRWFVVPEHGSAFMIDQEELVPYGW